jgi:hypothetical protein
LAQCYRNIVEASALDTRLLEFADMSVQYMFYGSDVQHRQTLDRTQATITVLDNINAECLEYQDDINKFQFAHIAPEEINSEALKAVQETLDDSSFVASKRCSAMSHSGKGNERQCTGYPVKGTELCARHTRMQRFGQNKEVGVPPVNIFRSCHKSRNVAYSKFLGVNDNNVHGSIEKISLNV